MNAANRALAAALAVASFVASGPAALAEALDRPNAEPPACAAAEPVTGAPTEPASAGSQLTGSALALRLHPVDEGTLALGGLTRKRRPGENVNEPQHGPLSPERARVLLRSLTIPGWGQATIGHNTSAAVFGIAELGVWATFTAFRIQVAMRRDNYERTARLFAGIDLDGRDEEFRRIVGAFISSDEYNRLVVYRDAANLYYDNPTMYRQYIAEHSLGARDSWDWGSDANLERYQAQRKRTTEASQNANTMLAVAVVNRLLSALHAGRVARDQGHAPSSPRSWNIEIAPSDPNDVTAFRFGIHARF